MTTPLSPEAREPRYTMDEIRAALAVTRSFHADVNDDDAFADYVQAELEKARKPL